MHTILAYPSGRLRTLDARIVTLLVYLDTWVLSLVVLPFTEPRLDGADRHSAHNLLLVDHRPTWCEALTPLRCCSASA